MDLPKSVSRRGIVFYIQIAAAVVSLIIGLSTIAKESAPLVERVQATQRQSIQAALEEAARRRAFEISRMGINWQYRSNDGVWRYYSDPSCRYWFRTNIQGVQEYSENPHMQVRMASNPATVR